MNSANLILIRLFRGIDQLLEVGIFLVVCAPMIMGLALFCSFTYSATTLSLAGGEVKHDQAALEWWPPEEASDVVFQEGNWRDAVKTHDPILQLDVSEFGELYRSVYPVEIWWWADENQHQSQVTFVQERDGIWVYAVEEHQNHYPGFTQWIVGDLERSITLDRGQGVVLADFAWNPSLARVVLAVILVFLCLVMVVIPVQFSILERLG